MILNRVVKQMFVCKTKLNTWEMKLVMFSFLINEFYFFIY